MRYSILTLLLKVAPDRLEGKVVDTIEIFFNDGEFMAKYRLDQWPSRTVADLKACSLKIYEIGGYRFQSGEFVVIGNEASDPTEIMFDLDDIYEVWGCLGRFWVARMRHD